MPRRQRRPSPSTSPERVEMRASPTRIAPEPVFVPEPNEVREVTAEPSVNSDEEDLRAVLSAVAEAEAGLENEGDEARQGGAEGEEARQGDAETEMHQREEAQLGGAEGNDSTANAVVHPAEAVIEVNTSSTASAACAPHATETVERRQNVNLQELSLEQKREMFERLRTELLAEVLQIPTGNLQPSSKNTKTSEGNPLVLQEQRQLATGRAVADEDPHESLKTRAASASGNADPPFTARLAVAGNTLTQRQSVSSSNIAEGGSAIPQLPAYLQASSDHTLQQERAELDAALREIHPAFRPGGLLLRPAVLPERQAGKEKTASTGGTAGASAKASASAAANASVTITSPEDADRVDVSDGETEGGGEAKAAHSASGKEKSTSAIPTPGVRPIQGVMLPRASGRTTPPAPTARGKAQATKQTPLRGGQSELTSFLAPQAGPKAPAGKATPLMQSAAGGGAKKRAADAPLFPVPPPKFGKQAATHDQRVAQLLQLGWKHADVVNALEASKDEEGEEDVQLAHTYLEDLRQYRLQNVNAQQSQQPSADDDVPDKIREGSELALYIAGNPDHIDIVLAMSDVHERARGSHHADHFRTAANLMAHPKVTSNPGAQELPAWALKKIALAVVNDCPDCEQLRKQEQKAKAEAQERAKHVANIKAREAERKAEQEALRKKKEDEERAKRAKADAERPPTPTLPADDADKGGMGDDEGNLGFDPSDSKWARKKGSGLCWHCGDGDDEEGNRPLLYRCDVCDHPYHVPECTRLAKITRKVGGKIQEKWSCRFCLRDLPATWKVEAKTPRESSEAPGRTPAIAPRSGGGAAATPGSATRRLQFPAGDDVAPTPQSQNPPSTGGTGRDLTMQIKSYELWHPLPENHPIGEEEHPTKGLGRTAYQSWKKTNVSLRDQYKDENGTSKLGPLINALTTEMRVSVGNVLIQNPELHPKPDMAEEAIKLWLEGDPESKWVKKLSDKQLIRYLDAYFSVLDPEPFLSMKFPASVPSTTSDGDVNYCAISHNTFAEKWLNRLKDLRNGGWDDSSTDLRETYVSALETNPTLHDEARRYKTTSHDLLISHLRQWTQRRTSEQLSHKQRREQVKQRDGPAAPAAPAATPPVTPQRDRNAGITTKEAKALRTQINQLQQQLQSRPDASAGADKMSFYCNGCGYRYSRDGRKIPCEPTCVFVDHAEHNQQYKNGAPWPADKPKLYWGTPEEYLKKHGKEMPEKGKIFVAMREKFKRKREESNTNTHMKA